MIKENIMHNLVLSSIDPEKLINSISEKVTANILEAVSKAPQSSPEDPLNDLIPKSEVRGKLASSSSLWKWEKSGKIQAYGIGGKRFYKRSELMAAIIKLKK
jgi:hypothetical protein